MKKLILTLLILSPVFSYWEEIPEGIKGKEIKKQEENYFVLTAENDIKFELKKSKSIKVSVQNTGSEVKLYLYKNGEKYKTYKISDKKDIKIFLRKGRYSFKTEKGMFHLKFFEWKKRNLKSIEPVGGGFSRTLLIKDKKYTYYRVTKDTSCTFKIKGPETLYLYVRGDFGEKGERIHKKFKIKVFDGGKEILSKEFKGKSSKKSIYTENKKIVPGQAEKFEIKVPEGIHSIRMVFEEGTGTVKGYVKKKEKKFKIGLEVSSGYDSNIFKFSDRDIDLFINNEKTHKFSYVKTIDDLFFGINPSISLYLDEIEVKAGAKFKIHYKNEYKNYGSLNLNLKLLKKNYLYFKIFYMPYYFSGPVYLKEENLTYPLKFSHLKIGGGCELKKYFLKPCIEAGVSRYNFSYEVFDYLDAFKYYFILRVNFKNLTPSIKIYYTDPLHPLSNKNWSNFSLNTGFDLNYKFLNAGFDFETRMFTTDNPYDTLHYKRKDFKINLYIESTIKFEFLKFSPFIEYQKRFVRNPYEGDLVEILKDYEKFLTGIKIKL